jgi:protein O-GlcNAc transferase
MTQLTIDQSMQLAIENHRAGRLAEAEEIYRRVLVQRPNHPDALHMLGVIAHQTGRLDTAVELIKQAIRLKPDSPDAYYNLGNALGESGRFDEAIVAFRQAIQLRPGYAETYNNLGNLLRKNGRLEEAHTALAQATRLKANFAEAHNNLGIVLGEKGQLDESIAEFQRAIALKPDYAEAHNNLGNALKQKGQLEEATAAYRQAIILHPNTPEVHNNLGIALRDKACLDEAIAAFRQAIALRPNYPEAHYNLGIALKDSGQLDDAVAAYRQAINLNPGYADAHNNLGQALAGNGQLDDAIAAFRRAVELEPDKAYIDSNLVCTLHFHPSYDAKAISEENRRWNRQHAAPLRKFIQPHPNDRSPDRRLRIGYLSPDFRSHVVGRNLLPLFDHHDRRQFEITCYAHVLNPDATTSRFQKMTDRWRNIVGLSDEQVAKQIREDRIDILVDLALHMAHNQLLVFARKPAPVQATFAGYPGSTGLDTVDYRLTDPYLDPPGLNDQFYSETSIRLPDTFWCYDPLNTELIVNGLPAQSHDFITLGSLNNFCKVTEQVARLWAQVLRAVDRSRLMILCPEGSHRQPLLDLLQREEVNLNRIELVAPRPRAKYLELYHRIDVGLDTFPYNGHTTSLDSFWMGVPVITLVGNTVVGRAGLSQLTNLGLPELIARTPQEYVRIAAGLANDLPRLAELRRTLRPRMEASPLMDAPRFARNIEAAYRQMWRTWCAQGANSEI